jgi:subtilisin-like proprotein convertase family protein
MNLKFVCVAIATALVLSAPAIAQQRPGPGKQPTNVGDAVLGLTSLPGETCTGATGTNCPSTSFSTSVTSTFTATGCGEGGVINDVNVGLDIAHDWVGDLRLTLTSPEATSVVILDQPGTLLTGAADGCGEDDVSAILDDDGSPAAEDACYTPAPAVAGTLSPNNLLAAFNNVSGAGTWTLLAEDLFPPLDDGNVNDWSLEFACGDTATSRATFRVTKDFTDDNPGEVTVSIDCNTGLILDQDKDIAEGEWVEFVVTDFDDGELNCTITEDQVDGYGTIYSTGTEESEEGCEFTDVGFGFAHSCHIVNTPFPVELTVNKTWLYPGTAVETDEGYALDIYCDTEIEGGYEYDPGYWVYNAYDLEGNGPTSVTVHPTWQGQTCSVFEYGYSNAVEADYSDCGTVPIVVGEDASCEIINTVFYEGIPTLSQYGLAILALSMLGLGVVGFRRYS